MNYYKESVAYDYELFAPKNKKNIAYMPERVQKQQAKAAKKAVAPKAKAISKNALNTLSKVLTAVVIIAVVCLMIYTRVEISETHAKIDKAKKQIQKLESEKICLNMELEQKISYQNIEQAARALGMQKKEKSQVHYINISDKDSGEVLKSEKNNILATLSDAVSAMVE